MKVTVCFGENRVVVPCDDGDITVDELKMRALIRYRRLFAKGHDDIIVHLKTKQDNASLDPTDPVRDVLDDRELILAEVKTRGTQFKNEGNSHQNQETEEHVNNPAIQDVENRPITPTNVKIESMADFVQNQVKNGTTRQTSLPDGIPHPSGMKLIVEYSKQAAEIQAMKSEGIELPEDIKISPYKCNVCNLKFKTVANLAAHSVAHVRDRPYKCQKCSRSFSQFGNLEQHERSHGFRRTKVIECTVCGKTLRNPDNMKRHMYIHTGERPFACPHCQKGFRAKTDLKVHIRIHTGERPYKCEEEGCNRAFNDRSSFRRHKMVHSNIKNDRERYKKFKGIDVPEKQIPYTGEVPYTEEISRTEQDTAQGTPLSFLGSGQDNENEQENNTESTVTISPLKEKTELHYTEMTTNSGSDDETKTIIVVARSDTIEHVNQALTFAPTMVTETTINRQTDCI